MPSQDEAGRGAHTGGRGGVSGVSLAWDSTARVYYKAIGVIV